MIVVIGKFDRLRLCYFIDFFLNYITDIFYLLLYF
jgi:hypothetical protein